MGNANSATSSPVPAQPLSPEVESRFQKGSRTGKLRILCLHGHGSNSDITQIQVNALGLSNKHEVDCDFFQAAHLCDPQNSLLSLFSEGPFRTWFNGRAEGSVEIMNSSLVLAFKDLMQVIDAHGPYDGTFE